MTNAEVLPSLELDRTSSSSSVSSLVIPKNKNDVESVKAYVHAICADYLGGIWKEIEFDDFPLERMSGGLSNYMYKCELDEEKLKPMDNEPMRILIRLYGVNRSKSLAVPKDLLISTIMSTKGIGPKLYGVFSEGRLEELIQASCLEQDDMYIPEFSSEIARIMAQFHTAEMPFIKEPNWLWNQFKGLFLKTRNLNFTDESKAEKYAKIQSSNLEREYQELRLILEAFNSPVVFCHNDVNIGNILNHNNGRLMLIDYEYGSYNYRGFDIGNFFCEWMMDNNYKLPPFYQYHYEYYPNHEQQLAFVKAYIKGAKHCTEEACACKNIDANNNPDADSYHGKNLDEEMILKEANHFALASSLFWTIWAVNQAYNTQSQFQYLDYSLDRLDAYFKHKKILFPDGYNVEIDTKVASQTS